MIILFTMMTSIDTRKSTLLVMGLGLGLQKA